MPRRTLVVDASVAVKWILPEEDTERALRLQESYQDEEIDLISPYLVVSEVANVVWKRQRRGDFSAAVAQRVFLQFREQRGARSCGGARPSFLQLPVPGLGLGTAVRSHHR
jgi:predicted nucleic acid-binding protein